MTKYNSFIFTLIISSILLGCGGSDGSTVNNVPQLPTIQYGIDSPFVSPQWSGDHAVGTKTYYFEDVSREELHTDDPNDRREFVMRLLYPTSSQLNDDSNKLNVLIGKTWDKISKETDDKRYQLRRSNYENSFWNVEVDAPILESEVPLPVVFFSHGFSRIPEENIFIASEFASRGYVVVLINHSYDSTYAEMPDGRVFDFIGAPGLSGNLYVTDEDAKELSKLQPVWAKDQVYVMDQLQDYNSEFDNFLYQKIDVERIMVAGYSFGGGTSFLTSSMDDRVIAAVDLDGGVFTYDDKSIDTPFMLMQTDHEWSLDIFDHVYADGYQVFLRQPIHHGAFADNILFWQWDYASWQLFEHKNAESIQRTVVKLVDEFLMKYYRGEYSQMLDEKLDTPEWMKITDY
jgi:dienelactone hydrolase